MAEENFDLGTVISTIFILKTPPLLIVQHAGHVGCIDGSWRMSFQE